MKDSSLGRWSVGIGIAVGVLAACGGGNGGDGGGGSGAAASGFGCSVDVAGQKTCYVYRNLTSSQDDTVRSACMSQGNTVVTSCPTENAVGCCAMTLAGVDTDLCYYWGTSSADKTACDAVKGQWTDGSAAVGGDSGASSGSTGDDGGSSSSGSSGSPSEGGSGCVTGDIGCSCYPNSTCNGTYTCLNGACVANCATDGGGPICCPGEYCSLGAAHGYAFAYSDAPGGGTSSATLASDGTPCVSGSSVGEVCSDPTCYSTHWGAGIGVNLNQDMGSAGGTGGPAANFVASGSSGLTYAISQLLPNMRLIVGDGTTDYCVVILSLRGTVPWTNFSSACWDPTTGTTLSGPPTSFTSVRFQVPADDTNGGSRSFRFCVDQLGVQ